MVVYSERPASMYSQLQVLAAPLMGTGWPLQPLSWIGFTAVELDNHNCCTADGHRRLYTCTPVLTFLLFYVLPGVCPASHARLSREGASAPVQALERAAEASGGLRAPQLQFHNLVNNADVVPRLLGTSLEALHDLLETYIPMIQVPGSALSLPQ